MAFVRLLPPDQTQTLNRIFTDASQGFISEAMCAAHLPAASPDTVAFMCGPPAMIKFACIPNLTKIGYNKEDYFNF